MIHTYIFKHIYFEIYFAFEFVYTVADRKRGNRYCQKTSDTTVLSAIAGKRMTSCSSQRLSTKSEIDFSAKYHLGTKEMAILVPYYHPLLSTENTCLFFQRCLW